MIQDANDVYISAFQKAAKEADRYAKRLGYIGLLVKTDGENDATAIREIYLVVKRNGIFEQKEIGATYLYPKKITSLVDESVMKLDYDAICKKMLEELKIYIESDSYL